MASHQLGEPGQRLEQSSDTVMVRVVFVTPSAKSSLPLRRFTRTNLVCSCRLRTLVTSHSESGALPIRSTLTSNPSASCWPMVTMPELPPAAAEPAGARIIPVVTPSSSGRLAVTHIDEVGSGLVHEGHTEKDPAGRG